MLKDVLDTAASDDQILLLKANVIGRNCSVTTKSRYECVNQKIKLMF